MTDDTPRDATTVVSLEVAKRELEVFTDDFDAKIADCIRRAVSYLESEFHIPLLTPIPGYIRFTPPKDHSYPVTRGGIRRYTSMAHCQYVTADQDWPAEPEGEVESDDLYIKYQEDQECLLVYHKTGWPTIRTGTKVEFKYNMQVTTVTPVLQQAVVVLIRQFFRGQSVIVNTPIYNLLLSNEISSGGQG